MGCSARWRSRWRHTTQRSGSRRRTAAGRALVATVGLLAAQPHAADARAHELVHAAPPHGLVPARSTAALTTERLAGADRYATAAAVASYLDRHLPGGVRSAMMAPGLGFAEGVVAGGYAGFRSQPLLLKAPGDGVDPATLAFLRAERRQTSSLFAIGPRATFTAGFETLMTTNRVYPVVVEGRDRYDTAVVAYHRLAPFTESALFLASGEDFPDALSASAVTAATGRPLVLTPRDRLYPGLYGSTTAPLTAARARPVVVLGGPGAVSDSVLAEVRRQAPRSTVTRVAGADRWSTAVAISRLGYPRGASTVFLVNGRSPADALSAGASAGALRAPVLLADTACVPRATLAEISRLAATRVVLVGGTGVLTRGVAERVPCAY